MCEPHVSLTQLACSSSVHSKPYGVFAFATNFAKSFVFLAFHMFGVDPTLANLVNHAQTITSLLDFQTFFFSFPYLTRESLSCSCSCSC